MSVENLAFSFSVLPTISVLSLPILLSSIFFISIFTFLLYPGGLAWAVSLFKASNGRPASAIPGPAGLPLVGLGFAFTSENTHRVLAKIANRLNAMPLMAFSVGLTRYIIASQPEIAKEILNSSEFADRPIKESAYELLFNRAMGFAPFGDYWRNLRRISATYLFSPRRISSFGVFREEIGLKMVEQVNNLMGKNGNVEIKNILHFGSLNNVMMSVFGKGYDFFDVNGNEKEGEELEGLVKEGYELLGIFNWGDHFAPLKWLDLQGVRSRSKTLVEKVNVFVGKIIDEHRMARKENDGVVKGEIDSSKDFVDVLLDLDDGENKLDDSDMIALLWEMIFRGTDTVAILLEWILARMVIHPDIQAKAQAEIDSVIGSNNPVTDSDLPKLPYLQAIIKETLRVHPPGPLLSWARLSIHDTYVGPHFIPAGTTAIVNMWAITHDDKIWPNANEFNPERFMEEDVPIMGSELRLAPFGAGRRVCPGKAMGMATVQLWLAQMLQNFKWVPSDQGVDLTECLKLSMEMKKSLVCKAVPRIVA
ncbi:cytochrome P450 78A5-like [Amaranthus tricolor]|uniref:cytochrome P450 78A5-like n=1 Tax=Amaranthus tricolor TaxID=29722 RepID=UPI0025874B95|nr:cytochrome P450 78A5-like [Amaranthus tricolor]